MEICTRKKRSLIFFCVCLFVIASTFPIPSNFPPTTTIVQGKCWKNTICIIFILYSVVFDTSSNSNVFKIKKGIKRQNSADKNELWISKNFVFRLFAGSFFCAVDFLGNLLFYVQSTNPSNPFSPVFFINDCCWKEKSNKNFLRWYCVGILCNFSLGFFFFLLFYNEDYSVRN